jgi:hypothetical protein
MRAIESLGVGARGVFRSSFVQRQRILKVLRDMFTDSIKLGIIHSIVISIHISVSTCILMPGKYHRTPGGGAATSVVVRINANSI